MKYLEPTQENIRQCANGGDQKFLEDVLRKDGDPYAARMYKATKGKFAGQIICEYPWLLSNFFGLPKNKKRKK